MATIETSIFDTLITVTFRNDATDQIDTIICADRDVLAYQLHRITEQDHLTIVCVTNAAVARAVGASPSFPAHELHSLASPQIAPTDAVIAR